MMLTKYKYLEIIKLPITLHAQKSCRRTVFLNTNYNDLGSGSRLLINCIRILAYCILDADPGFLLTGSGPRRFSSWIGTQAFPWLDSDQVVFVAGSGSRLIIYWMRNPCFLLAGSGPRRFSSWIRIQAYYILDAEPMLLINWIRTQAY